MVVEESETEEDSVLTVLKSVTQLKENTLLTRTTTTTTDRQAYENRLLTFQAATYYAKPACLSPLICARFGWRNADKDMLVCSCCKAALAITFPSRLSVKAVERICHTYRQQLATAHEKECPFRFDAGPFLRIEEQKVSRRSPGVPTYMVSVLPPEMVQLLEHPRPSSLLRQSVEHLGRQCPSTWCYPSIELAPEIEQFRWKENKDDDIDGTKLISDVSSLFGDSGDATISTLAMLGWTPIDDEPAANTISPESSASPNVPVVSLGCPICLSLMELTLDQSSKAQDNEEEEDRPLKKQKKLARFGNPYAAHRHYCPFTCGFPKSMLAHETPIWRVLLTKLCEEKESRERAVHEGGEGPVEDLDLSFERIRKILRSAIVHKKVDLSEALE